MKVSVPIRVQTYLLGSSTTVKINDPFVGHDPMGVGKPEGCASYRKPPVSHSCPASGEAPWGVALTGLIPTIKKYLVYKKSYLLG